MKKVKVSELQLYESLKGLYTLGVTKENRSVKVSLEFIETKTTEAVLNAEKATESAYQAISAAQTATTQANIAAQNANESTVNCKKATEESIKVTEQTQVAKQETIEATQEANTATENAQAATQAATQAANTANNAASQALKSTQEAIREMQEQSDTMIAQAEKDIQQNIDKNNQATGEAVEAANAATEAAQNATVQITEAFTNLIPTGLAVQAPTFLTIGNKEPNYIKATLAPENTMENIIFMSDNRAVDVDLDGKLTIVAKGVSRIHVIPTMNTKLAKTILVQVGDPTMRLGDTRTQMRFTSTGAIRFN